MNATSFTRLPIFVAAMYEFTFLLSEPAFGGLQTLHDVLLAAAAAERPQELRPRLQIGDSELVARFGRFHVHLRHAIVEPRHIRVAPTSDTLRPELRSTPHRFELRTDADPHQHHAGDVLWLVAAIALIPGVIVMSARAAARAA